MAFQVPPSKKSKGQDKFEFEIDGAKFSVRRFGAFSLEEHIFMRSDECGENEMLDLVFGKKGTKLGNAVRALEAEQYSALQDAWMEDSEVTPGESQGSSS